MAKIQFSKNLPEIEVENGTNLMQALLAANLPVASSCHGDGICGKCRIQIVHGRENLSQISATEQVLRDRLKIHGGIRISCQTQVNGNVEVDTSYW